MKTLSNLAVALTLTLWATGCIKAPGVSLPRAGETVGSGPVETTTRPSANFMLEGKPFCFLGTNNYYVTYQSQRMTDDVLESARALGLRVVRVWGFIDRGSLDGSTPDVDGEAAQRGVYFQYWDPAGKRPAYNDGATGLDHLDYVLDQAHRLGLKIMIVLTNNWRDFGGMDQYLAWYGVKQHHRFYADAAVTGAFKDWAAHLIGRRNARTGVLYREDPTIFGWELANEPRCINGKDLDDRSGCSTEIVTSWAAEMTTFIKSIDQNHLVSVGDEGFFGRGSGFGRDGRDGVDHAALLALEHVDFGTYHLYPDTWRQGLDWASTWIEEHIEIARLLRKPTLLEEYGVMAWRSPSLNPVDAERRSHAYARWHEILQKRGGNGGLFWMLAGRDDEQGLYPDYDHFTMYAGDSAATATRAVALQFGRDAQACRLQDASGPSRALPVSAFVTVTAPP